MRNLKKWIESKFRPGSRGGAEADAASANLSVAALLVEILRADYQATSAERRQALTSVRGLLGLGEEECEELLLRAEQRIDQAHDLYQFTSQINRAYSHGDKVRLLEQLWRVAQADDFVHKYEEHLIRRVADLLHVSHREFIAAKLRATEGRG